MSEAVSWLQWLVVSVQLKPQAWADRCLPVLVWQVEKALAMVVVLASALALAPAQASQNRYAAWATESSLTALVLSKVAHLPAKECQLQASSCLVLRPRGSAHYCIVIQDTAILAVKADQGISEVSCSAASQDSPALP